MSSRVGVNLRASAYLHQGDRKYMEDEFQVAYQRTHDKKDIEYAFFGIFDGHGGKEAANFAKDNLMDQIVSLRAFWSDDDEDVLAAIKEGFLQTHLAMWKELDQWPRTASGWPSTSGTTASVAFIRRQKIYIGHVGDSGIVLGCEEPNGVWRGEALTRDHKPENIQEKNRIMECGGKVINKSGVPRVVWNRPKFGHQGPVRRSTPMDEIPFLAVARSLGDLWSYNATNDQFVVSPEPDVCVVPIDITRHRCLIFGTDGLWNMLTPDNSVTLAHSAEKNNEKHYLGVPTSCGKQRLWVNPSKSVVAGALGRYLKLNLRADNTSAVTVFLDPPGRPKREVLLQQKGMKKGSPIKPVKKITEDERNREATVKVHVYNQNQPTKHEGIRGLLRIKERLPEKWQTNSNQDTLSGGEEEGQGCDQDACEDEGSTSDSRDPLGVHTPDTETTKVGCSECGCANVHAVPSTSGDNHSVDSAQNIPATVLPQSLPSFSPSSENEVESRLESTPSVVETKSSLRDDIQIPVVSSSTLSPKSDNRVRKPKPIVAKGKGPPNTVMSEKSDSRRKTRSNINSPAGMESENREQTPIPSNNNNEWKEKDEKAGTSAKDKNFISPKIDSAHRVLKSVNRGTPELPNQNTCSPKVGTPKRKRLGDMESEPIGPIAKAARVHTRAHTWSRKPMVTRSQDKTHKTPAKQK
ncbi:uncharacterized protein Pp2C1 [Palaemon carinicauda]|uniref:uncharacterized protein Pp2C1 n=1 Tax=Palaemon carinicauda TaxID=392227 RepID=UPI0035B6865B